MFLPSQTQGQPTMSPIISKSKVIIDEKYILKTLIYEHQYFYVCEAIDLTALKLVNVYLKLEKLQYNFSKKIKEELRNKSSPKIFWSGNFKIENNKYNIQIHEKYGPSLKSMFNYIKKPISQRDFLLLMLQLIRLVQRYATVGYVYRQLDMSNIVFDPQPQKNDIFLLNVFSLKKKGEDAPILNTRFCSKGAHLGLKPFIKDDLQSICYILLNIQLQGQFLKNIESEEYLAYKINLDLNSLKRHMPPLFINFYNYVANLNYNDEVNFYRWRNMIYQIIGRESINRPFQWMTKEGKIVLRDEKYYVGQIEDQIKPGELCIDQKMKSMAIIKRLTI